MDDSGAQRAACEYTNAKERHIVYWFEVIHLKPQHPLQCSIYCVQCPKWGIWTYQCPKRDMWFFWFVVIQLKTSYSTNYGALNGWGLSNWKPHKAPRTVPCSMPKKRHMNLPMSYAAFGVNRLWVDPIKSHTAPLTVHWMVAGYPTENLRQHHIRCSVWRTVRGDPI